MSLAPTRRIRVSGARGESFADVARRIGDIGGVTVDADDADDEVLDKVAQAAGVNAATLEALAQAEEYASLAQLSAAIFTTANFAYATKAEADAAIAGITANAFVLVYEDETRSDARSIYRKTAGVLVFVIDPTILTAYTGTLINDMNSGIRFRGQRTDQDDTAGINNRSDPAIFGNRGSLPSGTNGSPNNFYDDVSAFGTNYGADFSRLNSEIAAIGIAFEGRYYQSGCFATEWQIRHTATDAVEYRPIQGFFPETGVAVRDVANIAMRIDKLRLHDWANVERANFDMRTGDFSLANSTSFRFGGTNHVILKQRNTANNAYLNFTLCNNRDEHTFENAQVISTATQTNEYSRKAVRTVYTPVFHANAAIDDLIIGAAVTGNAYARIVRGSATGAIIDELRHTDFDSTVQNYVDGGGVCGTSWNGNGNQSNWTAGTDRDSGEWILAHALRSIASNLAIRVHKSTSTIPYLVEFAGPLKLVNYTVAGLPNPTSTGAGGTLYCTNETGGAVLVFSDGTNWRRVTDRAIAA